MPDCVVAWGLLTAPPTNNISVAEDLLAKDPATGKYIRAEPPSIEVQNGCKLFKAIPHVFELHGTKRFVKGDPLAEFLTCMRRQGLRAEVSLQKHIQKKTHKLTHNILP